MTARKKSSQINLLPIKGFASSTTGRVLAWILSTFRIIVIITEILVMFAFLSRFWFDAQNADLDDEIKEKKYALEAAQSFEKQFLDIQKKLQLYADITKSQKDIANLMENTSSYLPADAFLSQIVFSEKGLDITGLTANENSIQQYIVNLQSLQQFDDVALASLKMDEMNTGIMEYQIKTKYRNSQ